MAERDAMNTKELRFEVNIDAIDAKIDANQLAIVIKTILQHQLAYTTRQEQYGTFNVQTVIAR